MLNKYAKYMQARKKIRANHFSIVFCSALLSLYFDYSTLFYNLTWDTLTTLLLRSIYCTYVLGCKIG